MIRGWNPIPGTILVNLETGVVRDINDTTTLATVTNFEHYDSSNASTGVEVVLGTLGNNTITTGSAQNFLFGLDGIDTIDAGAGDDTVHGGEGADTMFGGAGIDTLSYETYPQTNVFVGVDVDLGNMTAFGGEAEGDTFFDFENLRGTDYGDTLRGDGLDNVIEGRDGDDILEGRVGADTLDGGDGSDTAVYIGSTAGVTIDLDMGTASGGEATGDVLTSIENLLGSDFADNFTGNVENNFFEGNGGDDMLFGGDGDDVLSGGDGDDNLAGDAGDDVLTGGLGDDILGGGDGNDSLTGGAGLDTHSGGAGCDDFNFTDLTHTGTGINADVITDFELGDTIILGETTTTNRDPGADLMTFIGTAAFNGVANEFRYEKTGGQTIIQVDTDGDGNSDSEIIISNGEFDLRLSSVGPVLEIDGAFGMTTAGDDKIFGTGGMDVIDGGDGNDFLRGMDGDDTITGGLGDDTINGGAGNDTIDGGDGIDTYTRFGNTCRYAHQY